jgi:hypothetical protein
VILIIVIEFDLQLQQMDYNHLIGTDFDLEQYYHNNITHVSNYGTHLIGQNIYQNIIANSITHINQIIPSFALIPIPSPPRRSP